MIDFTPTWKKALEHNVIKLNMDWGTKEPLFYVIKNKKTPTEIIKEVKEMHWKDEDKSEIQKLINKITGNMTRSH